MFIDSHEDFKQRLKEKQGNKQRSMPLVLLHDLVHCVGETILHLGERRSLSVLHLLLILHKLLSSHLRQASHTIFFPMVDERICLLMTLEPSGIACSVRGLLMLPTNGGDLFQGNLRCEPWWTACRYPWVGQTIATFLSSDQLMRFQVLEQVLGTGLVSLLQGTKKLFGLRIGSSLGDCSKGRTSWWLQLWVKKGNFELEAKVQKRISYITQFASRSTGQGISKSLFTMRRFKVTSQKLNHSGKN